MKSIYSITFYILLLVQITSCSESFAPVPTELYYNKVEISSVDVLAKEKDQLIVTSKLRMNNSQIFNEAGFYYSSKEHADTAECIKLITLLKDDSILFATINNLNPNTKYYIKAYVKTNNIILFSPERSAVTMDLNIEIDLNDIVNTTSETAIASANIVSNENLVVIERGFCWSDKPSPSITSESKAIAGSLGQYSCTINDLLSNTTYYVRAYLKNKYGIYYSNQKILTTKSN